MKTGYVYSSWLNNTIHIWTQTFCRLSMMWPMNIVYSVLPVELAPPPVISNWGRFAGWYSASNMVNFNFVCDFSGLLKWRQNWWSRLRPWHVKLQILKKNAALCLANDPLCLLNKTRNSSLRRTSHQVQALGSGLIILYLPLCKVDCIRMA